MKKINQLYGKSNLIWAFIVVFVSFLLANCEIQEDFEYEYNNPGGKLGISAWEFIQQKDSLSMMEEAVIATGLQEFYSGDDVKTFIIPENKGFRSFMKDNAYTSINDIPVDILKDKLKYHIVKDRVIFSDPELLKSNNPIAYQTENGEIMYLSHDTNYRGIINQNTSKKWTIITSNLEPTNGVIHITQHLVYLLE